MGRTEGAKNPPRELWTWAPLEPTIPCMKQRHLRLVTEAPAGPAYVVGRSRHRAPGTPFVLAECADHGVAAVFALAGQEIRSAEELRGETRMSAALDAWEAGDRSTFELERKASAAYGTDAGGGRAPHPSLLGKPRSAWPQAAR